MEVYTAERFGEAVEDAFASYEADGYRHSEKAFTLAKTLNAKLNQLKDTDKKDVVAYIAETFKTGLSDKNREREFRALARFVPKEFFAALYLNYRREAKEK